MRDRTVFFVKILIVPALAGLLSYCDSNRGVPAQSPDISVTPQDIDFNDVVIGNSSAPAQVTISNSGNTDLSVSGMTLFDTTNFILVPGGGANPCGSTIPVIPAGGSCTVEIIFAPLSIRIIETTLRIPSDDPDEPIFDVALTGNEVPSTSSGLFILSPQDLNPFRKPTKSVAFGDIDNDGDLDIVIGNSAINATNEVWFNNGFGIYGFPNEIPGSFETRSIVLGDVNRDDSIDFIEGNGELNRVLINDGFGVFFPSTQPFVNRITASVSIGDVEGDGDLDFVAGNLGQPNELLINDGTGNFILAGQTNVSRNTSSVVFGDLDDDGDLDIVFGLGGVQTDISNKVFFNNGFGLFFDSGQDLGSSDTRSIALGDVDGDGDLDLVTGNSNDLNGVWINTNDPATNLPTGIFLELLQPDFLVTDTRSIALGDLNGDGELDIVAGNFNQQNRVYLNDGLGIFTELFQQNFLPFNNSNTQSVALGDVDSDGDLDIITGNSGEPNRVWINQ